MNKVSYKTIQRVAYNLSSNGKLDKKTRHLLFGGEVFVDGKLVKIIPIVYTSKIEAQNRVKKVALSYKK
jgi:hypothetical protein